MIFVYNFLQLILLIITFPVLLIIILVKDKYRTRIADRLGKDLEKKVAVLQQKDKKTIWIHSLSVGEVTSALPLVKGIHEKMDALVVFSATTRTGMAVVNEKIRPYADSIVPAPLDMLPVVCRFIDRIRPDLFILVETDFWPNWLHSLHRKNIPVMLVNGRISKNSFEKYNRFHLFFQRLFKTFSLLSMQTDHDASQMVQLGVPEERIKILGNLKYDTMPISKEHESKLQGTALNIPEDVPIWVCGSTHPGEEDIILSAFANLQKKIQNLHLILAPRDPARATEIKQLITNKGLLSMRRSTPSDPYAPILILDTIGELADCYQLSRVAFIGGSLIDFGGHNPLEAAAVGVPVLFGPYMDDFLEIARDLEECGGAITIESQEQLEEHVLQVISNGELYMQMSKAASDLVRRNTGVVENHLQEISVLLSERPE